MPNQIPKRTDPQLVELAGRSWLIGQLLQARLEVARPERDRGIDLIAYLDLDPSASDFIACPIQVKASTGSMFSVHPKYEKFHRMLLVYVWNVSDSQQTVAYALTYEEALEIARKMRWTTTMSWKTGGKHGKRGYTVTRVGENSRLWGLLNDYRMDPGRWRDKVIHVGRRPRR